MIEKFFENGLYKSANSFFKIYFLHGATPLQGDSLRYPNLIEVNLRQLSEFDRI